MTNFIKSLKLTWLKNCLYQKQCGQSCSHQVQAVMSYTCVSVDLFTSDKKKLDNFKSFLEGNTYTVDFINASSTKLCDILLEPLNGIMIKSKFKTTVLFTYPYIWKNSVQYTSMKDSPVVFCVQSQK